MRVEYIIQKVNDLIKTAGTRNPFEICQTLDIHVYYMDLKQHLKAYYFYQSRISNIVIDENVMELFRPVLAAHELGHAILHKKIAMMRGFQELEVLEKRKNDPTEFEANLFAAELLLEDTAVLECLNEYTFFETANILQVPAALLDFKFSILQKKGYALTALDYARADFLKKDKSAYKNLSK